MNKKTLAALKASIQHWRENEAAETFDRASVDGVDCALCQKFLDCHGCPVYKSTGEIDCRGTPYYRARAAWAVWAKNTLSAQYRDAFRSAAKAEREFLESLLPEGER